MHIPDGFIAPQVYLPAFGVAAIFWWHGLRQLRGRLDESTLPRLASLTALAFVLMTISLPLPAGTSAHATGIAILALNFGIWTTFVAVSLVLLLQAVLFGAGGITALPVNAIAMGLLGAGGAWAVHRLLRGTSQRAAVFGAGWVSMVLPSLLTAAVLGIHPMLAHDAQGDPLFFPFDLAVTLPAIVVPHAILGIGEGVLTLLVQRFIRLREGAPQ